MQISKSKLKKFFQRLVFSKKKRRRMMMLKYQDTIRLNDERTYKKLDKEVRERKLFLDSSLSLASLSDAIGINRTYVSRAVCIHHGTLRQYLNKLRMEYITRNLEEPDTSYLLEDGDLFAYNAGFRNERSLNKLLVMNLGKTYQKIRNELVGADEN